ncbi:MAG: chorismate synthase [Armatimonadota bacterium]
MLRFLSAGESHGPALTVIVDGMPAGLHLSPDDINIDLQRRQKGYGRGGRMKIESDTAEILSGVRHGRTLGSPITVLIRNRDWENWRQRMSIAPPEGPSSPVTVPRPGHADLAGMLKYGHTDIRNVIERASARETAARVAAGAIAKALLRQFNIQVVGHVVQIGHVLAKPSYESIDQLRSSAEESPVRCADPVAEPRMMGFIDFAMEKGDSVGGVVEVVAEGVPPGIGSYSQWDRRLDGRLAQAVMSIHAIKGVEIGMGFTAAGLPGSRVHDEIYYEDKQFKRRTNNAGGIEGGVSNGERIVVRAAMKPIPTLLNPLRSVDVATKQEVQSRFERSDVCAVPAAAVVAEAMVAFVLAQEMLVKFGGDSLQEVLRNYNSYMEALSSV